MSVDDKLALSLDDLIAKERNKSKGRPAGAARPRQQGRGPYPTQQRMQPYPTGGGRGGRGPVMGHPQQRAAPGRGAGYGGRAPSGGGNGARAPAGDGPYRNLRHPHAAPQQQLQQQQYQGPGPQRRASVFQRLGGPPIKDMQMEFEQQQQQQFQHMQPSPNQWRAQQQPQQQQQPVARQPMSPELIARRDEDNPEDVMVSFRGVDVVKVCATGDVYISHGNDPSEATLKALNDVLGLMQLKITAVGNSWSVSDGRRMQRFEDGMLVPSKGPATAGRCLTVRQAFGLGAAGAGAGGAAAAAQLAAASAASTAAAMAAGILPAGVGMQDDAALRRLRAQGRA